MTKRSNLDGMREIRFQIQPEVFICKQSTFIFVHKGNIYILNIQF